MLSGTGRHRRPRQAPAIFVTAGVTSAGLALPLLGATGAHAADAGTWDRVAQCESGGIWSAATGNAYFGGLRFTQQMWEDYGGRDFAPRADLASRAQQITVAERVLAERGPEAWSGCAAKARLAEGGDAPDVDPGLLGDSSWEPGALGRSSDDGSDHGNGAKGQSSRSGTHARKPSEGADGSGKGGHGSSNAKTGGDGRGNGGLHASRDEAPGRAGGLETGDYTVRPGDSLSEIADHHSVSGGWSALYGPNKDVLGSDPNLIRPGQHIELEHHGK